MQASHDHVLMLCDTLQGTKRLAFLTSMELSRVTQQADRVIDTLHDV